MGRDEAHLLAVDACLTGGQTVGIAAGPGQGGAGHHLALGQGRTGIATAAATGRVTGGRAGIGLGGEGRQFGQGGVRGLAQQGHIEALGRRAFAVHAQGALAAGALFPDEALEGRQVFAHQSQLLFGKAHLRFVLVIVGGAGGEDHASAGAQQARGMGQQQLLQAHQALELVALPELEDLGVLFHRAPAGAGGIQLDGVPGAGRQGQGLALEGAGAHMRQVAGVQVGPQGGQAGAGKLVAQHEAVGAGELAQEARLAARARAHVQHGFALPRRQGQGRQHGRPVLDIDVAEKGGQRGAQRPRFAQQAAAEGRERLGFELIALGAQQALHLRHLLRRADQTKRTPRGAGRIGGTHGPFLSVPSGGGKSVRGRGPQGAQGRAGTADTAFKLRGRPSVAIVPVPQAVRHLPRQRQRPRPGEPSCARAVDVRRELQGDFE